MNRRRLDFDLLRVLSMLGVVYLHVASGALRTLRLKSLWSFANVITAFATPAVPLFLMMSGALLLNEEKTADLSHLFRRRIPKVLLPLCVWSALVMLYSLVNENPANAYYLFSRFLAAPVVVPYWFLYALIPIYLISPLLKRMTDHLSNAHWNYMMGLWMVATLGLYTVRSFVPEGLQQFFTVHWTLNLNLIGGYLGYFLLGAYLDRLDPLPPKKLLFAAFAALITLSIGGTYWDSYSHMSYSDRFTNYMTLFTMLLSAVIFLLAKSCLHGRESRGKLLPCLSGISFGVYLIHPLAIGVAEKVWEHFTGALGPNTIPQHLFFYAAVVLFCIVACVILSSIPVICYLFTGQTFSTACKTSSLQALFRRKPTAKP